MVAHKDISCIKMQAKQQLLGNYQTIIKSLVVVVVSVYCIMAILMSVSMAGNPGMLNYYGNGSIADPMSRDAIINKITVYFIGFVAGAILDLLLVGYLNIVMSVVRSEDIKPFSLYFAFKNHPDKVLIMYIIMLVIHSVAMIPVRIAERFTTDKDGNIVGAAFFVWIVVYVICAIVVIVIDIMYALRYLIYIDDPEQSVRDIMARSRKLMKGNVLRYAYMYLSLIGYALLGILSFGIGFLWITAYKDAIVVNFYDDIRILTGDKTIETAKEPATELAE